MFRTGSLVLVFQGHSCGALILLGDPYVAAFATGFTMAWREGGEEGVGRGKGGDEPQVVDLRTSGGIYLRDLLAWLRLGCFHMPRLFLNRPHRYLR